MKDCTLPVFTSKTGVTHTRHLANVVFRDTIEVENVKAGVCETSHRGYNMVPRYKVITWYVSDGAYLRNTSPKTELPNCHVTCTSMESKLTFSKPLTHTDMCFQARKQHTQSDESQLAPYPKL